MGKSPFLNPTRVDTEFDKVRNWYRGVDREVQHLLELMFSDTHEEAMGKEE